MAERALGDASVRAPFSGLVARRFISVGEFVQTGAFRNGRVEVVSGLDARDQVVTRGHTSLVDGSTVIVRNIDGTPTRPPDGATGPGGSDLD